MQSLSYLGEKVGMLSRPFGVKALAEVFGMFPPFSLIQLFKAIENDNIHRPFYIVGHNTNSIADIKVALERGANAVEVDVNVYEEHQDQLCVSETGTLNDDGGNSDAPAFDQFLIDFHEVLKENPENLALVVFDCKPKVATPQHGTTI